jgi:putative membrane protein
MRLRTNRIHLSLIAGAFAAAALGACKKSNEYASNDTSAARTDSAAGRRDTTSANAVRMDSGTTTGKWADASVLGYVVQANDGEIAMGKLGERMATNPKVKAFARTLVTDHQKLLSSDKQLAKQVSATPDLSAGDANDLKNHDSDEIKDLSGKTKGADWDKEFINQVIDGHQKILSQLQDAGKNTQNATMRASIEKATGVIQEHLTKAQDIKTNVLKD